MPSPLQIALAVRGLNYSDLAARVERSPAWIAELAKGRRQPSDALGARIAEVLEVDDPADLFGERPDEIVIRFIRRTTVASGVPEKVSDSTAVEQVARLLRGGDVG